MPPATILGLASSCFVGDLETASSALVEHASNSAGGYVCLCNVHVLTHALHDHGFRRVLSAAAIRFPDGAPVAWLLRRTGHTHARRIGGPDLLPRVVDRGQDVALRHFLVGSTSANLERLSRAMVARSPRALVIGAHAPPYVDEPEIEDAVVESVAAARAQIVWVGLGAPKQELWMARAAPLLPNVTFVGVGAAFDFLGGTKSRAPLGMQKLGLEWLHRLGSEPRRLASRYARSNAEFVFRAMFELARRRLDRPERT